MFLLPVLAIYVTSENHIKRQSKKILLSSGNKKYYQLVQYSENFQIIKPPTNVMLKLNKMCTEVDFSRIKLRAILKQYGKQEFLMKYLKLLLKNK